MEFTFDAEAPLRGLQVAVGIDDTYGKRLVTFNSSIQGADEIPESARSGPRSDAGDVRTMPAGATMASGCTRQPGPRPAFRLPAGPSMHSTPQLTPAGPRPTVPRDLPKSYRPPGSPSCRSAIA